MNQDDIFYSSYTKTAIITIKFNILMIIEGVCVFFSYFFCFGEVSIKLCFDL